MYMIFVKDFFKIHILFQTPLMTIHYLQVFDFSLKFWTFKWIEYLLCQVQDVCFLKWNNILQLFFSQLTVGQIRLPRRDLNSWDHEDFKTLQDIEIWRLGYWDNCNFVATKFFFGHPVGKCQGPIPKSRSRKFSRSHL